VLIGYIVSRDIWYVVPVRAFTPRKNLWFYPDGSKKGTMFEKFREALGIDDGEEVREVKSENKVNQNQSQKRRTGVSDPHDLLALEAEVRLEKARAAA